MQAPKCGFCGMRHWDRVCPDLWPAVTVRHPVLLEAALKSQVTAAGELLPMPNKGGRPRLGAEPMTTAERVRKWRAARRKSA